MAERWPALLTAAECCEYLGIGMTKFKELRASRFVESVRIGSGRCIRFRRVDLDRFVESLPTGEGDKPLKASTAKLCG